MIAPALAQSQTKAWVLISQNRQLVIEDNRKKIAIRSYLPNSKRHVGTVRAQFIRQKRSFTSRKSAVERVRFRGRQAGHDPGITILEMLVQKRSCSQSLMFFKVFASPEKLMTVLGTTRMRQDVMFRRVR